MISTLHTPTKEGNGTKQSNGDFSKLTPVNIQCLTSPIKGLTYDTTDSMPFNERMNNSVANANIYTENFNLISKQLEKLLKNLNIIYQKIGYSKTEILNKEKLIFNSLSTSITEYFDHAEDAMNELSQNNDLEQDILNKLLILIDDSTGTQTIPDLYTRNSILSPGRKTVPMSPKKEVSLLSKRKLILEARGFVYKAFIPKLLTFLKSNIKLQKLVILVNEDANCNFLQLEEKELISILPALEESKSMTENILPIQDDNEAIFSYLKSSKNFLLHSDKFTGISEKTLSRINRIISQYEAEYTKQYNKTFTLATKLLDLFQTINLQESEINQEDLNIITKYSYKLENFHDYSLPVHHAIVSKLEVLYDTFNQIYSSRLEEKETLEKACRDLWIKLKFPEYRYEEFITQNSGLSEQILENYREELKKLNVMKKKLIKTLITDTREKIDTLWNTLNYTDEDKQEFLMKFEECNSLNDNSQLDEKLLEVCDLELKHLEDRLAVYKPMLRLYEEFKSLVADSIKLDNSSKDSSRLLSRNSHKILLQEEKMRKKIIRHFPRVIQELKEKLEEMNILFGRPFMTEGGLLVDIIEKTETELIGKYPRIRLNTQARERSPSNKTLLSATIKISPSHKVQKPPTSNTINSKSPHVQHLNVTHLGKTPIKQLQNMETSTILSKKNLSMSIHRHNKPPRLQKINLSPNIAQKHLHSSTNQANNSKLQSHSNSKLPLRTTNGYIRPTRLFQVSMSKLNKQGSQIPTLSNGLKNVTLKTTPSNGILHYMNNPENKENMEHQNINQILPADNVANILSSPYKEPENSVYKIFMSPEGKCQLNIRETYDEGFDDTSIMEDENDKIFLTWKQEQLDKLNNSFNNNTNILQERE